MAQITDRRGNVHEFRLDIDRVVAYEMEHPEWNLIEGVQSMRDGRFSTLNLLVGFLGVPSWADFSARGLDLGDLMEVLGLVLEESGFTTHSED